MNKKELQEKLDELRVKYDKRWGIKKLQATLEEKLEKVVDEVTEVNKITLDEVLEDTVRIDGDGAITKSGILIPSEALQKLPKTPYKWRKECAEGRCLVFKKFKGRDFFVREYNKELHGEEFTKLAQKFVDKNNK